MANRKLSIGCVLILGGAITNCGGVVETPGDDMSSEHGGASGSGQVGVPGSAGAGHVGVPVWGGGHTGVGGAGPMGFGGGCLGINCMPGVPPIYIGTGGANSVGAGAGGEGNSAGDDSWGGGSGSVGDGGSAGDGSSAGDGNSVGGGAVGTAPIAGDHG